MFQTDNELKALATTGSPRLKYFEKVILRGLLDGVPANLKLWDLKPPGTDDVGSEEREAKFEASLNTLAEELKANPEQIEATRRAFDAPIGVSLVD